MHWVGFAGVPDPARQPTYPPPAWFVLMETENGCVGWTDTSLPPFTDRIETSFLLDHLPAVPPDSSLITRRLDDVSIARPRIRQSAAYRYFIRPSGATSPLR